MRNLKKYSNHSGYEATPKELDKNKVSICKSDGHTHYDKKVYSSEIEYLESTSGGKEYIDTEFMPNQDTRIVATMQCVTSNSYARLFGAGMYNAVGGVQLDYETGATGTLHISYGPNTTWTTVTTVRGDYNTHTYDYNKNEVYIDSVKVSDNTYASFQSTSNLRIFTYINNGTTPASTEYFIGRCYSFQIYDNGVLVRDLIPVRVKQVGYMYDKISKRLFGNSGMGEFALGPDI